MLLGTSLANWVLCLVTVQLPKLIKAHPVRSKLRNHNTMLQLTADHGSVLLIQTSTYIGECFLEVAADLLHHEGRHPGLQIFGLIEGVSTPLEHLF